MRESPHAARASGSLTQRLRLSVPSSPLSAKNAPWRLFFTLKPSRVRFLLFISTSTDFFLFLSFLVFGDSCGNRTRVAGVRGRSLNRLTNRPYRRKGGNDVKKGCGCCKSLFAFPSVTLWSSPRPISTAKLNASRRLHTQPIYLVVFKGSYSIYSMGYLILEPASRLDAFSVYPIRT